MTITYHENITQGDEAWYEVRRGKLTASEMKLILTPTLKIASNEKERTHLFELLAQRISGYVEPSYIGADMIRGMDDELEAREKYRQHYAPVTDVGFITNDKWGFTIGYSPDGLVGDDGLIEVKSRRQKFQIETIIDAAAGVAPADYMLQLQTGLLVSERKWIDFISYSGGLPMVTVRVFPDPAIQAAIVDAATQFEARLAVKLADYHAALASKLRTLPTERKIEQEMFV